MQKRCSAIFLIALIAFLVISVRADAHPHVYVDASVTFVMDDSGLTAIKENWLFDEIFTQAILSDLELTPETLATTQGQGKIHDGAFQYLANFGYFTLVEASGKRVPIAEATDFRAKVEDGRLVYDFTLPVTVPLEQMTRFRAAVFDPEYYTDVLLVEDAIAFEVDGMVQVTHSVRPAKDHTYWQFIVPKAIHLAVSGSPNQSPVPQDVVMEEVEGPSLIERVMEFVRTTQKELTQKLNAFGMQLRDNPFGPALWMFLGLSFVYGIVHAVGPGHGKAVVCSYFLSNPGSLMTGALMGNAITFVHMGSAALAVGAAYMIFSTGMGGFAATSLALQPFSYGLLALLGLVLAFKAVRDISRGGLLSGNACSHDHEDDGDNLKKVLTVSFVTGLIPCPGAAVILAFSIGLNIFWTGVMALLCMAAGMGLTTTLFAWAAVSARSATLALSGRHKTLFNWVYAGLSLCGASAIALFGGALFYSSISG